MSELSRRQFVKKAAITGAAITAFPYVFIRKANAIWEPRTVVHPNIDNLRVVGITDPNASVKREENMVTELVTDKFVVKEVVWNNLDKLACSLAQTQKPEEAWKAIFVKPPRKSWSDVVVAIKTNSLGEYTHSSALISKICHSLTETLNVRASNIHIYDAGHGFEMDPIEGLPQGCRVEKLWSGIKTKTTIAEPWTELDGKTKCLRQLVDGTIDILINIAKCRKHTLFMLGGFSMTMKNHFGSFHGGHGHKSGGSGFNYFLSINQSSEILGHIDKQKGHVIFPRQQLCIIDALWVESDSRFAPIQANFLAMGVLSPVVDYQVATKIRAERMGLKVNMKATQRMLTAFGYSESDLPEGGRIINA